MPRLPTVPLSILKDHMNFFLVKMSFGWIAFPNLVQIGESLQLQNLSEAAEIEIYDLSGKLITKPAASFQYVSNLRASNGKEVALGVYVLKILDEQTEQYEGIKVIVHQNIGRAVISNKQAPLLQLLVLCSKPEY